ncbi:PAS domain-containing protein [Sagittula salina]|uniref:PAS domain-containing protein n=1 Tax=Sagittula salina TaxID=2820268 RepID=UPI001FD84E15|nr:PAS domain-containing protein [Sagittula salina]
MFGKNGNGQDIVSMTAHEKTRREAPLRQVEAYWRGLCDATAVPLRSQIDPRGMERALENAFLMERIAPSMAKIRVAGSHLNDLMGMQVAGMPLSSLIAPTDRERFGQGITAVFADPAIVRMELKAEGGFGKPEMTASLILLPLRSDFGDMTRGLGALVSHGRIGRTPRRFKVEQLHIQPALETSTGADHSVGSVPPEKINLSETGPLLAPTEPPAVFRSRVKDVADDHRTPERGHLTLVVDNG